MRSFETAFIAVVIGIGTMAAPTAQAQDGYASHPLPITVHPRSWLDNGHAPIVSGVPGAGGSSNPALNPALIAASNQLTPVYGPSDRYGRDALPDPITNGPFIGAQSSAVRNVDLSFVDRLDPTSPLNGH